MTGIERIILFPVASLAGFQHCSTGLSSGQYFGKRNNLNVLLWASRNAFTSFPLCLGALSTNRQTFPQCLSILPQKFTNGFWVFFFANLWQRQCHLCLLLLSYGWHTIDVVLVSSSPLFRIFFSGFLDWFLGGKLLLLANPTLRSPKGYITKNSKINLISYKLLNPHLEIYTFV